MADSITKHGGETQGDGQGALVVGIRDLSAYIEGLRREIASLSPGEVKARLIDPATDELDATIEATAAATNTIMDVAEKLDAMGSELTPVQRDKLTGLVTQIFEACTFQDITGQRIRKVITAMRAIEERIAALAQMAGGDAPTRDSSGFDSPFDNKGRENGPQMTNKAPSQADIDAMFASGS
jgi:chemotaxis protein CheZ